VTWFRAEAADVMNAMLFIMRCISSAALKGRGFSPAVIWAL
jgi:hypothetical protein